MMKSRERVIKHGEVFTPEWLVNDMLDLVKDEVECIESRILDPACGTGNFLINALQRKLAVVAREHAHDQWDYERYAIFAMSTLYGIDILGDNVNECRQRLYDLWYAQYVTLYESESQEPCSKAVEHILSRNIVHGDTLAYTTMSGDPIIFSEWNLQGDMIIRRDFLFHDLVSYGAEALFTPEPMNTFPPIHVLHLR